MTGADDPYIFSTDIRHDPLAGDVTHVARLGPVEAAILRFRNDAVRNRVLGLAFNRRRQGKLRVLITLAEQDDVADPEPALGQRAGLVEPYGVSTARALTGGAVTAEKLIVGAERCAAG